MTEWKRRDNFSERNKNKKGSEKKRKTELEHTSDICEHEKW